jgi:hypothetical protein
MNDTCLDRNPSLGSSAEQLDELSVVGYLEEPEVGSLFESSGIYLLKYCVPSVLFIV